MDTQEQEIPVEQETKNETPTPDFSEQLKAFGETMIASFNDRFDSLNKKYDDLRHTMTMQVDTHTAEEPTDWSWENLRETMFPHTVG
nr:MAG TPA: hypothetical protein [Caudoviricetes sp.]